MCHRMTKPTKWPVRPAKTQISLGIWSESSLSAWRKVGSLATHKVGFVMRRLIMWTTKADQPAHSRSLIIHCLDIIATILEIPKLLLASVHILALPDLAIPKAVFFITWLNTFSFRRGEPGWFVWSSWYPVLHFETVTEEWPQTSEIYSSLLHSQQR